MEARQAASIAASFGVLIYQKNAEDGTSALKVAPLTIDPTQVQRELFEQAVHLASIFNKLIDGLTRDVEWLLDALKPVAIHDAFIENLIAATRKVYENPAKERHCRIRNVNADIRLHVVRSDYMIGIADRPKAGIGNSASSCEVPSLKQVEINTIAASFGGLATKLRDFHQFCSDNSRVGNKEILDESDNAAACERGSLRLVENRAAEEISQALCLAHRLYCESRKLLGSAAAVILFVVCPDDDNEIDQRFIEVAITRTCRCVRLTLASVSDMLLDGRMRLTDEGTLIIVHDMLEVHVSVVYFRSTYDPTHFASERDWTSRVCLELSNAVKCPSLPAQLAGMKKVQAMWCKPNVLERYLSKEEAQEARKVFAVQLELGSDEADSIKAVQEAIQHPKRFVLKPQREGGGHNLHGDELKATLQRHISDGTYASLSKYILMDRIEPRSSPVRLLRQHSPNSPPEIANERGVFELGVFGVFVSDGAEVKLNRNAGHLVRTKLASSQEGGVAAGFGYLSSPLLVGRGKKDSDVEAHNL